MLWNDILAIRDENLCTTPGLNRRIKMYIPMGTDDAAVDTGYIIQVQVPLGVYEYSLIPARLKFVINLLY